MSTEPLAAALKLLIGRLTDESWTEVDDLNDCGEYEAAITLMCTELLDLDVSITQEIYDRIRAASKAHGLGDDPFPQLESLVRD